MKNLTFEEIIRLNREKNRGTFLDRSWRDRVETEGSAYDDPSLSRWQKFKAGGYSVRNVGRGFASNLALQQRKIEFLEALIAKKKEFVEERDQLIVRMLEVKVINTFNMYRIPFMAGSFAFCVMVFFKRKLALHVRLLPALFLGGFTSLYNYQIGQYGLYKNVDSLFQLLLDKRDSQVAHEAQGFLDKIRQEDEDRYQTRLRNRREREERERDQAAANDVPTPVRESEEAKDGTNVKEVLFGATKSKKNEAEGSKKFSELDTEDKKEFLKSKAR